VGIETFALQIMTPHILIIDDRTNLSHFINMELNAAGYYVNLDWESDTQRRTPAFASDLVILNWELRSLSGASLCRQLSSSDHPVPVIVMTAKGECGCQAALKMGAIACLTKPFSIRDLLETIAQHLQPKPNRSNADAMRIG
jgi:DNA-binding response OmpR family regulator